MVTTTNSTSKRIYSRRFIFLLGVQKYQASYFLDERAIENTYVALFHCRPIKNDTSFLQETSFKVLNFCSSFIWWTRFHLYLSRKFQRFDLLHNTGIVIIVPYCTLTTPNRWHEFITYQTLALWHTFTVNWKSCDIETRFTPQPLWCTPSETDLSQLSI